MVSISRHTLYYTTPVEIVNSSALYGSGHKARLKEINKSKGGYLDVVYPGQHIYNIHDKKDTFTVEGVNADLRHYIPVLGRSQQSVRFFIQL